MEGRDVDGGRGKGKRYMKEKWKN